jgi:protein-tyrosine-phosphatase
MNDSGAPQSGGALTTIAFVCVHNAGRSQMAAAFARAAAPEGIAVLSGGTEPGRAVNPVVIEAMREKGIDLSGAKPQKLTYEQAMSADFFITMGCSPDEACPAGFRGDTRDWALPDPKGKPLEEVRKIRDDIESRVRALLAEIEAAPGGAASQRGDARAPR